MVSNVLAQAILNQQAPDIIGAFQQGQEIGRGRKARSLAGEALSVGGGESLTDLQKLDPQLALAIGESIQARSARDLNDFLRDAEIGKNLLESGNTQGFLSFAEQRLNILQQQGRDTTQTQRVRDLVASGDAQGALNELQAFSAATNRANDMMTSGQRDRASLLKDLDSDDQRVRKSAEVALGITPRASTSARERIAQDPGLTEDVAESEATIGQRKKFAELTGSSRAKTIDKGFDRIQKIDTGIRNLDRAIKAVKGGAGTGAIERLLPSIRAASVELDQIQNELALDVINSVTLGALSEKELDMAKQTALPAGLDGPELIQHLQERKAAQQKLRDYFERQIDFLDQGGTVAGFLRQERRGGNTQTTEVQATPEGVAVEQTTTPEGIAAPQNIGRFTVEVVE